MDVVGITESFEESLRLIAIRFGWESIEYSRYGAASELLPFPDGELNADGSCIQLYEWADHAYHPSLEIESK